MNNLFIYPGSFDLPTYGHLHIVKKFLETYDQPLTIVCSENPNKKAKWFAIEDIKKMWLTYELPDKVEVISLKELQEKDLRNLRLIMVRGIRDNKDVEYEKEIMRYNNKEYHINNFIYIYCDESFINVSSTSVKNKALNFDFHDLYLEVSPGVIRYLWKHVLNVDDVIMVTGRPGSGKTTLIEEVVQQDSSIKYINVDKYNDILHPKLKRYFQTDDLLEVVKTREQEVISVISKSWLDLLFKDMSLINQKFPETKIVLVEIAYGLQKNKEMYRFLGDHIINIWCNDNELRNIKRNTEHLKYFIDKIPDKDEAIKICNKNRLKLYNVCTNKNWMPIAIVSGAMNLLPIIKKMAML